MPASRLQKLMTSRPVRRVGLLALGWSTCAGAVLWSWWRFSTLAASGIAPSFLEVTWMPMLAVSSIIGAVGFVLLRSGGGWDEDDFWRHLDRNTDFLTRIINAQPAMIFVKDAKTLKYVTVNQSFADFLGYAPEHFIGRSDKDYFPKAKLALFRESDLEALKVRETVSVDEQELIERPDGSRFILSSRKVCLRHGDGQPRYLMGIASDITAYKEVSEALQMSEGKFMAVIQNAEMGVMTIKDDGVIDMVNPAAAKILKCDISDMVGMPYLTFVSEKEQDKSREQLQEFFDPNDANAAKVQREMVGIGKDGVEFPLWRSVTPIETGDGNRLAVMFRDMTNERKAQRELIEAKNLAEKANVAKSQFLATMSHELRTPLNAIIGFSELLKDLSDDREDSQTGMFVQHVHDAGNHLLALINDILDLSKIEAGEFELDIVETSTEEFFRGIEGTMRGLVEKNGNTLNVKAAGLPSTIETDATKLRQVIINLLSNAAKFTESGCVELTAAIEFDESAGQEALTVSVSDTGIGIEADKLEQVMSAFGQADASTTRKYGGTGLGLAISRQFCQMLGGDIAVTSVYGEGSTFTATVLVPSASWRHAEAS